MESNQFLHNLLLFGRLLRGLGLDVNTGRMIDLVQALSYINISQRTDFYHAARTLLVHNREDIALFDQAFELFWIKHQEDWITVNLSGIFAKRRPNKKGTPVLLPHKKQRRQRPGTRSSKTGRASPYSGHPHLQQPGNAAQERFF